MTSGYKPGRGLRRRHPRRPPGPPGSGTPPDKQSHATARSGRRTPRHPRSRPNRPFTAAPLRPVAILHTFRPTKGCHAPTNRSGRPLRGDGAANDWSCAVRVATVILCSMLPVPLAGMPLARSPRAPCQDVTPAPQRRGIGCLRLTRRNAKTQPPRPASPPRASPPHPQPWPDLHNKAASSIIVRYPILARLTVLISCSAFRRDTDRPSTPPRGRAGGRPPCWRTDAPTLAGTCAPGGCSKRAASCARSAPGCSEARETGSPHRRTGRIATPQRTGRPARLEEGLHRHHPNLFPTTGWTDRVPARGSPFGQTEGSRSASRSRAPLIVRP